MPSVSRRVFLDDVQTDEAVSKQFAELVRRAREEGSAVAIGHPYPVTLAVLERELPLMEPKGVRLVIGGSRSGRWVSMPPVAATRSRRRCS